MPEPGQMPKFRTAEQPDVVNDRPTRDFIPSRSVSGRPGNMTNSFYSGISVLFSGFDLNRRRKK
jgi:hypothetical protein